MHGFRSEPEMLFDGSTMKHFKGDNVKCHCDIHVLVDQCEVFSFGCEISISSLAFVINGIMAYLTSIADENLFFSLICYDTVEKVVWFWCTVCNCQG